MKAKRLSFKNLILWMVIAGLATFFLQGCANPFSPLSTSPPPAPPKPIKIGVLLPLTGPDARLGEAARNSMELAIDMENGKLGDRPLKLVIEDEGDQDEAIAMEKAKKLVQSDKVDMILGPLHDDSSLSVTNYTSSVPLINVKWSPTGYSQVAMRNKYAFWTSQLNQSSSFPLGLYASSEDISTVTTLSDTADEAADFMQGFIDGFRYSSGKVVQQQWVAPGRLDFADYLANLKTADAFVFSFSDNRSSLALLKQYDQTGLFEKMPILVARTGGLPPSVMQESSDNIIGTKVIEKYVTDINNNENRRFMAAYRQKYQEDPDNQACEAFNAMRVILTALKVTKGSTYPDILGPILRTTETELPTGHFAFTQNRTAIQTLRICEVVKTEGKFKLVVRKAYPPIEYYWQPTP